MFLLCSYNPLFKFLDVCISRDTFVVFVDVCLSFCWVNLIAFEVVVTNFINLDSFLVVVIIGLICSIMCLVLSRFKSLCAFNQGSISSFILEVTSLPPGYVNISIGKAQVPCQDTGNLLYSIKWNETSSMS